MRRHWLQLVIALILASHSWATITLNRTNLPTSKSTANPSFAITSSTGNILIITLSVDHGISVTGCSDNKSNSYTLLSNHGTGTSSSGDSYACTAFSATTAVTSVTITAGSGGVSLAVYDLSSSTGGALDTSVPFSAQSGANPAMAITAAGAGFVAAVLSDANTPGGVASPFTFDSIEESAIPNAAGGAHDVNASGGTLTATFTDSTGAWSGLIVSIKESSGSTPRPCMLLLTGVGDC